MGLKETLRNLIEDLKPATKEHYMKMQGRIMRQAEKEVRAEMEHNGLPPKRVSQLESPERK